MVEGGGEEEAEEAEEEEEAEGSGLITSFFPAQSVKKCPFFAALALLRGFPAPL